MPVYTVPTLGSLDDSEDEDYVEEKPLRTAKRR
jgi:hypothetical protein